MKTPTVRALLQANIVALVVFVCAVLFLAWNTYYWPDQWPIRTWTAAEIQNFANVPNLDGARKLISSCYEGANLVAQVQRKVVGAGLKIAALVSFLALLLFALNVSLLLKLRAKGVDSA